MLICGNKAASPLIGIIYVTSVLIGLLHLAISDDKATRLLIGLSVM